MNRHDAMLDRLPPIYTIQAGTVLERLIALLANQQEVYDEDMQRVQRSHWIDTAFDREDLSKLGALFEVPAMPWEPDYLYRTRLRATVAARLRGAVTRDVLEFVVRQILDGVLESLGANYMGASTGPFHSGPGADWRKPAFVEFPPVTRRAGALVQARGLLRALDKVTLRNLGLKPVPLQGSIRGLAGGTCMVPVLVNLTTQMVMAYIGDIPCGQELRFGADDDGKLVARLNGQDVRDRIYTATGFVAGAEFSPWCRMRPCNRWCWPGATTQSGSSRLRCLASGPWAARFWACRTRTSSTGSSAASRLRRAAGGTIRCSNRARRCRSTCGGWKRGRPVFEWRFPAARFCGRRRTRTLPNSSGRGCSSCSPGPSS